LRRPAKMAAQHWRSPGGAKSCHHFLPRDTERSSPERTAAYHTTAPERTSKPQAISRRMRRLDNPRPASLRRERTRPPSPPGPFLSTRNATDFNSRPHKEAAQRRAPGTPPKLASSHQAITVMLDFVNPIGSARRAVGRRREARLDETAFRRRGCYAIHGGKVGDWVGKLHPAL
jgi:hypothetical protein